MTTATKTKTAVTTMTAAAWELWYDGEKVGEYRELHLARQGIAG